MKLKRYPVIYLLALLVTLSLHAADPRLSLVKITVTSQEVNYSAPWKRMAPKKTVLSGCLIENDLILTHCGDLAHAVFIEMEKPGESRKYEAEVYLFDSHSKIGFLKPRESSFYNGLKPVEFSQTKKPEKKAILYSWDSAGHFRAHETEYLKTDLEYSNGSDVSLYHQFDLDSQQIREGNPVFLDDRLFGISSFRDSGQNIVYVSALENISRITNDLKDKSIEGMPFFQISSTNLKGDRNLKESLGLNPDEEGVYIASVSDATSGYGVLKKGDILLEVDGYNIDDRGLIQYPPYGKINYKSVLTLFHQVGDRVSSLVFRDGKKEEIEIELKGYDEKLFAIPPTSEENIPDFFLYGGLLFQNLTYEYLQTWGSEWEKTADTRLLYYAARYADDEEYPVDSFVILNKVYPHEINTGYQSYSHLILETVNEERVSGLRQARELINGAEKYVRLGFIGGTVIILDKKETEEQQKDILERYQIPFESWFNE